MNLNDGENSKFGINKLIPIVLGVAILIPVIFLSVMSKNISIPNNQKDLDYIKEEESPDTIVEESISSEKVNSEEKKREIENDIPYMDIKDEILIDNTKEYFENRIDKLCETMGNQNFFFTQRLLDESTNTYAYVLAKNEDYAKNLNGYFYYLLDKNNNSLVISPMILNLNMLFEEEDRQLVYKNKTYATNTLLLSLEDSLKALLGEYYEREIFDFIYSEYKITFENRVEKNIHDGRIKKYETSAVRTIYHDSFFTYIEIYITGDSK